MEGELIWSSGPGSLGRTQSWVLSWARGRHCGLTLFVLAYIEAIFFPIPPDILLLILALAQPERAFKYAAICLAGSVLGGATGFLLGMEFWRIGKHLVLMYVSPERFETIREYFLTYQAWAIAVAGFTPIPYKVFTLSAGFFRVDFSTFLIASALSRGGRFFIEAVIIYILGQRARTFIQRYFNILTLALAALVILGLVVLPFIL